MATHAAGHGIDLFLLLIPGFKLRLRSGIRAAHRPAHTDA